MLNKSRFLFAVTLTNFGSIHILNDTELNNYYNSEARDPSFFIINLVVPDSPKIILPKLTIQLSHFTIAFLEVHTIGKLILPVSAKMVNYECISSFNWGKNLNRMSQDMPGDILPLGTYST
jgi:hypothetical protein